MKITIVASALAMAAPALALSDEFPDSYKVADGLASVLAAQEDCDFTVSDTAIEAFVASNVAPADMQFLPNLRRRTTSAYVLMDSLTDAERAAFCFQAKRTANRLNSLVAD